MVEYNKSVVFWRYLYIFIIMEDSQLYSEWEAFAESGHSIIYVDHPRCAYKYTE